MDGQINSILNLSRIGRKELKLEPVDMKLVIDNILASLAHQIEERSVTVKTAKMPVIMADRVSMEQIMGNLLDNAIKYLMPGRPGKLSIAAMKRDGEYLFKVEDNGRGISADEVHKVFDLFRRAGRQDTPGEGMGLAYVKALVRRHSGRIWCESELGNGSTFQFSLPITPVDEAKSAIGTGMGGMNQ
jgi:signal transduction histidine kinase